MLSHLVEKICRVEKQTMKIIQHLEHLGGRERDEEMLEDEKMQNMKIFSYEKTKKSTSSLGLETCNGKLNHHDLASTDISL